MNGKTMVLLLFVAAFVLAFPFMPGILLREEVDPPEQVPAPEIQEPVTPPTPIQAPPQPKPMMTRNHFARVRSGMTYAQCLQIIGCEGIEIQPEPSVTAAFRWFDPDGRTQFTFGFRDGRIVGRSMDATPAQRASAEAGLRAIEAQTEVINTGDVQRLEQQAQRNGQAIVITLDEFRAIHPGMTYDQCVAIIGAENQMARGYAAQRNAILNGQARGNQTLDEEYPWPNPGGYYAQIAFHNGRMTGKAWKKGPTGPRRPRRFR